MCACNQSIAATGRFNPVVGGQNLDACRECAAGQDAVDGSAECTYCAKEYYRQHASSPASDCARCSKFR
eukprot:5100505-Prymnesium_polylepis.1